MTDPIGAAQRDAEKRNESSDMEAAYDSDTDVGATDGDDDPFAEMTQVPMEERDVLRMEVTVDVSGMGDRDREAIAELATMYENAFQEIVNKSSDYGWSFLTTGDKLAQSDGTPFDSATRAQAFGLLTRIGDKHERLIENLYGNGSAEVSDEPAVTAQEAANYYFLLSFVLNNEQLTDSLSDA